MTTTTVAPVPSITFGDRSGRVRLVPLPPDVREQLLAAEPGFVFPGRWGDGHMHPDAVSKAMRRAMGGAAGPHACRHRFGTRAYAATRNLLAVQRAMGHASVTSTEGYIATTDDELVACVEGAA